MAGQRPACPGAPRGGSLPNRSSGPSFSTISCGSARRACTRYLAGRNIADSEEIARDWTAPGNRSAGLLRENGSQHNAAAEETLVEAIIWCLGEIAGTLIRFAAYCAVLAAAMMGTWMLVMSLFADDPGHELPQESPATQALATQALWLERSEILRLRRIED